MSYKLFLLLPLFACSAATAQHQNVKAPMRVVSSDTIRASQPLAAHMPVTAPGKDLSLNRRKPVPLAGHKPYYGAMNDYVNSYVSSYLSSRRKTLQVVQERSVNHFEMMERELSKLDIPHELKYLSVIESALNNRAVSRAGAVGPWQFMAPTARLMGLHVSGKRDERTDWVKSTVAAGKYLSLLYDQLNDWLLVVAAYNSGPTPVLRAMNRTGSNCFWDIKQYLPRETQNHVLAFIATATIFENLSSYIGSSLPTDFDFSAGKVAEPAEKPRFTAEELSSMAIVRIKEPISIEFMAQELGIDKNLVAGWNDDYEKFLNGSYGEPHYSLRLPKEKLEQFLARKNYITSRSQKILHEQKL